MQQVFQGFSGTYFGIAMCTANYVALNEPDVILTGKYHELKRLDKRGINATAKTVYRLAALYHTQQKDWKTCQFMCIALYLQGLLLEADE